MKKTWAIVTGAAQRLGREVALSLASDGWNIILHCNRSAVQAQDTANEVKALGVGCSVLTADLSDKQSLTEFFAKATQVGPIRCLVNNAALFEFDEPCALSPELFEKHMQVNLMAPCLLTQYLHQHVPEGEQAVVAHLLDQKLENLNPDFFSYTLSKAGLATALKMQAMSLAPKVRVVGVSPGLTMISHLQTQSEFEKAHKMSPLNRSSEPADIAKAVLFLVNSPAITGVNLLVDGGQHLLSFANDFSKIQP